MRVVDCHGHFTSEPPQLAEFRRRQLAALDAGDGPAPDLPAISDQELVDCISANQLRVMDERGIDMVLFSPRASAMGHHVGDQETGRAWTRLSNDLVRRVCDLFPDRFAPVCQLPQTPGGDLGAPIAELRRCVEAGFVAANINPDPSGGNWTGRPVTDPYWFPLFEAMEELEVPGMIHVSGSCNPNFHALGAHYLNADTTVFMQLLEGDLFGRFPGLRFVIPHGGGAVPYHWGRYKGLAARFDRPPIDTHLMGNVFFDTCVYHRPGVELLLKVVPTPNVLFGSEMLGAVRGVNPETGSGWDDTRLYVESLGLPEETRAALYEGNVRRVYPRLDRRLREQGR
ncbi:MAG TPA: amidohydrolase family protein [Acidimicrobiales bacterium]|nr:amidohydrolase family protein [Acidimicrobiales bacterium]